MSGSELSIGRSGTRLEYLKLRALVHFQCTNLSDMFANMRASILQGTVALAQHLSLGAVTRTKGLPLLSHDHNLPLNSRLSQSLLHSPTCRVMRSDELSQGGSLNNYFALIKKGNVSLGGAALNGKVGVMDAGPPPT